MAVIVRIHAELVEGSMTWWADSPSIDGFSAAADSLQELILRSSMAVEELAELDEVDSGEIEWQLAEAPVSSDNPSTVVSEDVGDSSPRSRSRSLVLVA